MTLHFKDFSGKQYKDIEKDELQDGDVFICRTVDFDDPFQNWDYAVARMEFSKPEICGKFQTVHFAKIFACGI